MTTHHALAYSFPNGFQKEATSMFRWLQYERLNPQWRYRKIKGNMHTQIILPRKEIKSLRNLQVINPARYGNPPKPHARLVTTQIEVGGMSKGKPSYRWVEGYKVIQPNGRELQPYMRKLEAKRYCRAQGWEWIIYK